MKVILSYIKTRRIVLINAAIILLITTSLLWLNDIQNSIISYAFLLSVIILFFIELFGFYMYRTKYKALQAANAALPFEWKELPKAQDLLEELYQKMAEDLYITRLNLEDETRIRKQEMDDYYSLWVHQIKTPISAMYLLIQSFENKAMEYGEAETLESLQFLKEFKLKVFETEQYVDMVLSYFRMQDMSTDLQFQWCSIQKIVKKAIRKYSQSFILQKIQLEYEEEDILVLTDEKWIVLVVEQILSNALKYTKNGKISIYLEERKLVIEDTGIGILEEDLPRIFEKGFTGYNGRKEQKSTGIGLYLCQTICEKLGHSIRVESKIGCGTKVILDLQRKEFGIF
ncbi:MAG: sensor histidine kinase [Candidatus Ruminococcus intestinipullorum]|nr:sensor histidine kinase [Candidatus Ruminococcus intestinipullorum]